ncbi:Hpt domain-containing protein [Flavobacterium sp. NRK1]|uniref:Hpt domain-containing protein n=1 Tax=Flavobacterium sp. NRK1 TaxID=2954929 RepID=UPI002092AB94|nr:Hpt domain-containing protein [Flavobacterium sp. NRK1]MCO6149180.1 Hpt domain-containing protein [Flavobacterium sp. NRK1]
METPNLNYINELAGEDVAFKARLITILKKELPSEITEYNSKIQISEFVEAAGLVHKIKHKISILGMEKSYYIAEKFEDNLKNKSADLRSEFEEILIVMQNFIAAL